jgi:hypothetical protein
MIKLTDTREITPYLAFAAGHNGPPHKQPIVILAYRKPQDTGKAHSSCHHPSYGTVTQREKSCFLSLPLRCQDAPLYRSCLGPTEFHSVRNDWIGSALSKYVLSSRPPSFKNSLIIYRVLGHPGTRDNDLHLCEFALAHEDVPGRRGAFKKTSHAGILDGLVSPSMAFGSNGTLSSSSSRVYFIHVLRRS